MIKINCECPHAFGKDTKRAKRNPCVRTLVVESSDNRILLSFLGADDSSGEDDGHALQMTFHDAQALADCLHKYIESKVI